jgi:hypothetical protein
MKYITFKEYGKPVSELTESELRRLRYALPSGGHLDVQLIHSNTSMHHTHRYHTWLRGDGIPTQTDDWGCTPCSSVDRIQIVVPEKVKVTLYVVFVKRVDGSEVRHTYRTREEAEHCVRIGRAHSRPAQIVELTGEMEEM